MCDLNSNWPTIDRIVLHVVEQHIIRLDETAYIKCNLKVHFVKDPCGFLIVLYCIMMLLFHQNIRVNHVSMKIGFTTSTL